MKILLFEDNKTCIDTFNELSVDDVLSFLRDSASRKSLIKAFLARNEPLELASKLVTNYADLDSELGRAGLLVDSRPSASPNPTILLLDCKIGEKADITGILPTFKRLKPHRDLIIVLATSRNKDEIVPIFKKELPAISPFIVGKLSVPCTNRPNIEQNILGGLELWEMLHGSPYEECFKEFFKGDYTAPYRTHPDFTKLTWPEDQRLTKLQEHFPNLASNSGMFKFVIRQIFEIATFSRSDGVGIEGACFLSFLKAVELFPSEYNLVFDKIDWSNIPLERSQRSKDRFFMPPQTRDARMETVLAFGRVCHNHFILKNTQMTRAIQSVALSYNTDLSAGKLTWDLSWLDNSDDYPKNIREAYSYMLAQLKGESRDRPVHDASNALVEFIMSTTQAVRTNDRDYLRGSCFNVAFSKDKSMCKIIFED
jgi:hypothetical protein